MSREKLLINNPKSNNSEDMRNKQIEEMERIIDAIEFNAYTISEDPFANGDKIAEYLYNAGYRKQSEGEWIDCKSKMLWGETYYKCSNCESRSPIRFNYCPNCGAKMK